MGGCFSNCMSWNRDGYSSIPGSDNGNTGNAGNNSYQRQMQENEMIARQAGAETVAATTVRKEMNIESAFQSSTEEFMDILKENGSGTYDQFLKSYERFENTIHTVQRNFPGAMEGAHCLDIVMDVLKHYNITPENTLFAQSICPDEINHEVGDITNLFSNHLGEVFHMGGLAGLPFTGKTGFAAYSHHVPDNGNLFILIGSHIGISNSLQLGKFSRVGQERDGAACGAAVGALAHCCDPTKTIPSYESLGSHPHDYQMQYLISELNKRKDYILVHKDENAKQAELAKQTYLIAQQFLDNIVNTEYALNGKHGHLIILGGVQIRRHNEPTLNLYQEAFPSSVISKNTYCKRSGNLD